MERTLVILKPDVQKRGLAGEIIQRIERKGLSITNIKIDMLTPEILSIHYSHLIEKPFYRNIENYMLSGPVWILVVEGIQAVKKIRNLMGSTECENALPGTIRGDFAISTTENTIHGSDSDLHAEEEIKRFFYFL